MQHAAHEDLLKRVLDRVAELEGEVKTLKRAHPEPAVDHHDEPVSRRGLLKKVGGVVAAGVAGAAVGNGLGATPAGAANGDPVILGTGNEASAETYIYRGAGTVGFCSASYALRGIDGHDGGRAVEGITEGPNGVAVQGLTYGDRTRVGVRGDTRNPNNNGEGIGVHGVAKNGIGVLAEATGGYGLQVRGRAVFDRSGKVTIAQGQAARVVFVYISPASLVLATIQGYAAGVYVAGVQLDAAHSKFTIRLNKAAPVNLTVGWFIVN
jgi:hypothetical protein